MQKVQNLSQPWMIGMKVATEGVLGMRGAEVSRHVLPHHAAIEHDDVGALHDRLRLASQAVESVRKPLGVGHVHLTTYGPDVIRCHL